MQTKEDFPYNDREFEAFKKYELNEIEIPKKTTGNGEHIFVANAMGEPRRIITTMIRTLQPDWNDRGLKKDFLWYLERWEGVDFIGNPIPPVHDHIEGYYDEPIVKKILNTRTNQVLKVTKIVNNQNIQTEYDKLKIEQVRRVYYIPFSKKTLDKILEDTNNWENRESITYVVKVAPNHEDDTFSYEQFANWDFKTAAEASLKVGGARAHPYVTPELEIKPKQNRIQHPRLTTETINKLPDSSEPETFELELS